MYFPAFRYDLQCGPIVPAVLFVDVRLGKEIFAGTVFLFEGKASGHAKRPYNLPYDLTPLKAFGKL